jgi:hypothetical protein
MKSQADQIALQGQQALRDWLESCTRSRKVSRNTIAVGIVILDHLSRQSPLTEADILSSGGEIRGSRAGLGRKLAEYGIPTSYLKEVTTRQAHQDGQRLLDALEWGHLFDGISEDERKEIILPLISLLTNRAQTWLERQNLRLDIDRSQSPDSWISLILDNAVGKSGGVVEQHLVGAKLALRFPNIDISNHPAHAADAQTARRGDFELQHIVYHVTGAPSPGVIDKCIANLQAGYKPILIVPKNKVAGAIALAEIAEVRSQVFIMSIEDFVAGNLVELALDQDRDVFSVLKDIVDRYNQRLAEVETDMSLQIEVR